jgi:hypothetical protein
MVRLSCEWHGVCVLFSEILFVQGAFHHLKFQNLYNFFVIERNYTKRSHIVLHNREICMLPLAILKWDTRWRRMRRIIKCLLSKPLTFLGINVLLWRHNIIESVPFVMDHRGTLSTGLLNSLRKQEVCDKRAMRRKNSAHIRTEGVFGAAREAMRKSARKSVRRLSYQLCNALIICRDGLSLFP